MYEWVAHTGELDLRLEAASAEDAFGEALRALGELLGNDVDRGHAVERHEVSVSAPDLPTLLAEWLNELIYLAEDQDIVPKRASKLELEGPHLNAVVEGTRGRPPHLVKAATYHRLSLEVTNGVWRGTVVMDV